MYIKCLLKHLHLVFNCKILTLNIVLLSRKNTGVSSKILWNENQLVDATC